VKISEVQLLRTSVETRTLSGDAVKVSNVLIAIAVADSEGRIARGYGEAQLRRATVESTAQALEDLRVALPKLEGKVVGLASAKGRRDAIRLALLSVRGSQTMNELHSGSSTFQPNRTPFHREQSAGVFFGIECALIAAVAQYLDRSVPDILTSQEQDGKFEGVPRVPLILPARLMGLEGTKVIEAGEETLRGAGEGWFDIGRRLTVTQTVRWVRRALRHSRELGVNRKLYCYRPLKRSLEPDYPVLLSALREALAPDEADQVRIAIDFDTPTPESFYPESSRDVVRVLRPTVLPSLVEAQQTLEDAGRSSSVPIYLVENSGASSVGRYWLTQLANASQYVAAIVSPDAPTGRLANSGSPSPTAEYWRDSLEVKSPVFETTGKAFLHSIGDLPNYYEEEQFLEPLGPVGAKARLLQKAALLAGYSTIQYTKSAFSIIDDDNDELFFHGSATPLNTAGAKAICNDKETTRLMLQRRGIPVPQGRSFNNGDFETAHAYAEQLGYPVVVKPAMGTMGIGVKAGIQNEVELFRAFEHLKTSRLANQGFIVEKHIEGEEYRILVIGDEVVAAVRREAASVVGDGIHNVAELILRKNKFRRTNPQLASSPIIYSSDTKHLLEEQALTLSSVVEKNRYVKLASTSNISVGGDSREVLDLLHPSIVSASVEAVRAVPGLNYCGVDFILPNPEYALDAQSAGICELNAQAASGTAEYPLFGPSRPVPQKTIEHCTRMYKARVRAPLNPESLSVRLVVRGRVNGVGYREWFKKWADEFGLVGLIFMTGSRAVEVELQGDPLAVAALAAAAIRGPRQARPTSVRTRHQRRRLRARSFELIERRPKRNWLWRIR